MNPQQQQETEQAFRETTRPVGIVTPNDEAAVRALRALRDRRLSHAEQNIGAISPTDGITEAWAAILQGMLHAAKFDFSDAETCVQSGILLLSGLAPHDSAHQNPLPSRVRAFAIHQLGIVFRRQDLPKPAIDTHITAFRLRNEHGSYEELWESAVALGLDQELAGNLVQGQEWFRAAIRAACRCEQSPAEKQAVAWTHVAEIYVEQARWPDAVEASTTARNWWHTHDIAAPTATRADMRLGHTLLRQGIALLNDGNAGAGESLSKALRILRDAKDSFDAFGASCNADRAFCAEQIDFAERLAASQENAP